MLLHAAEYHEAAEPAYLNAQDLMPADARWPYYLGHLHKSIGQTQKAIDAFTRALDAVRRRLPTLVWLGRLYLDQGKPDEAEPLFDARGGAAAAQRRRARRPRTGGAGADATTRRRCRVLEEALAVDPNAASIHSPLAMAYRGLGDKAKAEAHLKQWRNTEVLVPDPLRQELDLSLESGLSYELRGVRALEARDFSRRAEGFFRKGIELTPDDDDARPLAAAQAGHGAGSPGRRPRARWRASRRWRSWRRPRASTRRRPRRTTASAS